MLLLLLLLIALTIWGGARIASGTGGALDRDSGHRRAAAVPLHRLRLLHASAQPGRGDHPVRRLSGHRPHDRPALGPAVDDAQEGCRSAPTTSFPTRSRSTTCAATRSRWRRRSSGAWSTPRRRCSTSTITSTFVRVQVEAAIRTIGSRYPYDDFEHLEVTLRGNHDEVGVELRKELIARLAVAGHHRRRMRLHPPRLCAGDRRGDAPPPAGAGGRRGAQDPGRRRGRNGRDGARNAQSEKNVVELDDERRAAMVSNLMVVLCGERDTQPVVNTGTLYT